MSYIQFTNNPGGTPGSNIRTLTGNSGGAVGPDGSYDINLVGGGALTVSGNPATNTLTITDSGLVANQYDTDSGSAVPSGNIITISGGTLLNSAGSGATLTVNADDNVVGSVSTDSGAVTPATNAFTIAGGTYIDTSGATDTVTVEAADTVVASVSTDGSAATPTGNAFTIAGGTLLSSAGSGSTVTLNAADTVVSSVGTDGSAATPSSNTFTIAGGTNITTSGSGDTVTINASADLERSYTSTAAATYTVQSDDEYIGVDSSSNTVQVELPNAPNTGRVYTIKDSTGSANTNNITVTTVGGAVNIDGSTTFVMNTNYQSINLIFSGSAYEIY